MIDAEDSFFGEIAVQNSVEFLRRRQSRPKGFSTTTRAFSAQPDLASPSATVPNKLGGIAK
jgi:hypothetical protein